jgi:RNA polymerase sigma-70 factor (ECF subfamily)
LATDEAASRLQSPAGQSALADRVAAGEAAAEEEFARYYRPRVLCLLRARLRDGEAARELADDAVMASLQALRAGRVTHADRLSAFVAGTARNIANNYIRTRARQPRSEPLDEEMPGADPVLEIEESERRALVRREIERMDATDRAVLELTLVDGLKPGEIAARLGLSSEVVRARKSRALRRVIESIQARSRTPGAEPLDGERRL